MEITRQNETFTLKDTTDVYEMNGSVSRDFMGTLNVNFSVTRLEGERVGDCYYNKYTDADTIHFDLNCPESNRKELAAYADTVIDSVLAHLESLI